MAKNDFQYGGWNSYTLQCGNNDVMSIFKMADLGHLGL